MSLGEREAELLDTLEAVIGAELSYVLVGGWAIAAFNQRFTTDVDVVIPAQALEAYTDLLTERNYEVTADVKRNDLYEGRTVRFTKDVGNPVQFDAMVDALGCRQTEAEWSYRHLAEHSIEKELRTARPITARIPEQELLFSLKLHSGRKADTRDLVVLAADADFERIGRHLHRGEPEKLAARIEIVLERLTSPDFEDAFKGVFEQASVPTQDIDAVAAFLRDQLRRLDTDQ